MLLWDLKALVEVDGVGGRQVGSASRPAPSGTFSTAPRVVDVLPCMGLMLDALRVGLPTLGRVFVAAYASIRLAQ